MTIQDIQSLTTQIRDLERRMEDNSKQQSQMFRLPHGERLDKEELDRLRMYGKSMSDERRDAAERLKCLASDIRYLGWVSGNCSDIPALRALGVRGEMKYRELDRPSLVFRIWRAVLECLGWKFNHGIIEGCDCSEEVIERLGKIEWDGFCGSTFTGVITEGGQETQLPKDLQRYWSATCNKCRRNVEWIERNVL